jgi:hypothetical protein
MRKNRGYTIDLMIVSEMYDELMLAQRDLIRVETLLEHTLYPSIQLIRAFNQALVTAEILKIKREMDS